MSPDVNALPSDCGRTEGLASCRRCTPSTPTEESSRIHDPSNPRVFVFSSRSENEEVGLAYVCFSYIMQRLMGVMS